MPGTPVEIRQRPVHPEAAVIHHRLVKTRLMTGIDARRPRHGAAPPVLGRTQAVERAIRRQRQHGIPIAQQHHALAGGLEGGLVVFQEGRISLPPRRDGHMEGAGWKEHTAGRPKALQHNAAALAILRRNLIQGQEYQRDPLQIHGFPPTQLHAVHRRLAAIRPDPCQRRDRHEALHSGKDRELSHILIQVQPALQRHHDR